MLWLLSQQTRSIRTQFSARVSCRRKHFYNIYLILVGVNTTNFQFCTLCVGSGNTRLARQQRDFGASRHSDHFAMLNAVQECFAIRNRRGEDAQYEFCQQRLISLPSVRNTSDAKVRNETS
jgi:hypothetical protein